MEHMDTDNKSEQEVNDEIQEEIEVVEEDAKKFLKSNTMVEYEEKSTSSEEEVESKEQLSDNADDKQAYSWSFPSTGNMRWLMAHATLLNKILSILRTNKKLTKNTVDLPYIYSVERKKEKHSWLLSVCGGHL